MTVDQLLRSATEQLAEAKIDNAAREAEFLLAHVLKQSRAKLLSQPDQSISVDDQGRLEQLLALRVNKHQPLAYILGNQPFLDFNLQVTPDVLIPRSETEYLVELVADKIRHDKLESGHFLDVGTGSGAIAIALKKLFPKSQVWASDVSSAALELAQKNAVTNDANIKFIESNLLNAIQGTQFDVIVANLPYVPERDWPTLQMEIRNWEPKLAVVAGPDGLLLIEKLIRQAPGYLKPGGWLALETGSDQTSAISRLIKKSWPEAKFKFASDLTGRDRFVFIQRTLG